VVRQEGLWRDLDPHCQVRKNHLCPFLSFSSTYPFTSVLCSQPLYFFLLSSLFPSFSLLSVMCCSFKMALARRLAPASNTSPCLSWLQSWLHLQLEDVLGDSVHHALVNCLRCLHRQDCVKHCHQRPGNLRQGRWDC